MSLSAISRLLCLIIAALFLASCAGESVREEGFAEIAPGVIHRTFSTDTPNILHVLDIDLSRHTAGIVSFREKGLVQTSKQFDDARGAGLSMIAAVNADFFSFVDGWPVGNQVRDGKIVAGTQSTRSHFFIDSLGVPHAAVLSFSGSVKLPGGISHPVFSFNRLHRADTLSFLNSDWYDSGSVNFQRTNFFLRPLPYMGANGRVSWWTVNRMERDTMTRITGEDCALACEKPLGGLFERVKVGDTLETDFRLGPTFVKEAVGGAGRLLIDGKLPTTKDFEREHLSQEFVERRHPRTFIGLSRDRVRLFICTVDGRQRQSVGMNFDEMSGFLKWIGAWDGLNLDGGGSTTMVIKGRIVNSPSDKVGERPVANTLMVSDRKAQLESQ